MANVLQIEWVFILNLLLVLLHFDVWVGNGICCRFTLLILCFGHLTSPCSYSVRQWIGAAIARSMASPPSFPNSPGQEVAFLQLSKEFFSHPDLRGQRQTRHRRDILERHTALFDRIDDAGGIRF
ncbi:MAG: hypothetical protein KQI78_04670 [Deltaproteobacteria bacterium]|nr:hypothetical protein [Deltaproteobacteria bacterium]